MKVLFFLMFLEKVQIHLLYTILEIQLSVIIFWKYYIHNDDLEILTFWDFTLSGLIDSLNAMISEQLR